MIWIVALCVLVPLLYGWVRGNQLAIVLMGLVLGLAGLAMAGNASGSMLVAMLGAVAGMLLACMPRIWQRVA